MPSAKTSHTTCHISDKIKPWDSEVDIRKSVCRDLETSAHADGKHYCLLHLPAKEKDIEKFETIRRARFEEVEAAVSKLEKLPEEERKSKLPEISYDFRYVWFPSEINLFGYKFTANAYFLSAVFSGNASFNLAAFTSNASFKWAAFSGNTDFTSTAFSSDTSFSSAVFTGYADFSEAFFSGSADFSSVAFSNAVYFSYATFSGYAAFNSTTFLGNASFNLAAFSGNASFNSAVFQKTGKCENTIFFSTASFYKTEFLETSEIFFKKTKFCGNVTFGQAMFEGFVSFEGNSDEKIFPGKESIAKVRAELKARFDKLKLTLSGIKKEFRVPNAFLNKTEYDLRYAEKTGWERVEPYERFQERFGNKEAILDLQHARLKKPERITFHTVRLRPNWFVNTDSRHMVFTDCRWKNIDQTGVKDRLGGKNRKLLNANINAEIQALTDRKIPEEKRLLEIACRQLAVNAEENNRYEDASKFRFMAMETKRLEYPWHGRFYTLSWWYRLSSGYGESWGRAALILLGIWLVFAWAYTGFTFFVTPLPPAPVGFVRWEKKAQSAEEFYDQAAPEDTEGERFVFGKALWYSGAVMALQRPEPKPATNWTRGLIILETILGPLQAALLALAIRRKFMR